MGWKSSICITRKEAINAIMQTIDNPYEERSNRELEDIMYKLNIGDDTNLPYFGHNFRVVDTEEEKDF